MSSLMNTASKASGSKGIKMNPYAIPFSAKPTSIRETLSGKPSPSDGPYKVIEIASKKNDVRMRTRRGTLPTMKFTRMQLIV